MIVLFTSLNTADLSDDDLDGPLMFLDMALYMCLSTVVPKIYGALQATSLQNGVRISSGMWHWGCILQSIGKWLFHETSRTDGF